MPVTSLVTVCIIVRDGAATLPRAIGSVSGLVDEALVLDTGSADNSIALARSLGARVVRADWPHDFASARNLAADLAHGEWCLHLDADESVRRETWPALHAYVGRPTAPDVGLVRRWSRLPPPQVRRLDVLGRLHRRSPEIRWQGRVHEQLADGGAADCGLVLDHSGYATEAQCRTRATRNLRLLDLALRDRPHDARLLSLRAAHAAFLAT
jgi:glycosyltransferase involved in cell wall biosynthesis